MTFDDIRLAVSGWAVTEPLIRRAYLFGSRAKGTNRNDSDVDIAVIHDCDPGVLASCDGPAVARFLTWFKFGDRWKLGLQACLPVVLDLQPADRADIQVVWPALKQCRWCLYRRGVEFIEHNGGGVGSSAAKAIRLTAGS